MSLAAGDMAERVIPIPHARSVSKSAASGFVLATLIALLVYPKPLGNLAGKYTFLGAYVTWILSMPLLVAVAGHRLYRNTTTSLLWVLRWWAVVEYLLVCLTTQEFGFSSLFAWAGAVAPTFLYEVGAFVVMRRIPLTALRLVVWLGLASVVPVFIAAVVILGKGGIDGLLLSSSVLRQTYHYGWLNHVALLVLICLFVLLYIGPHVRGSVLMSGLCLMILVVTFSRAGAFCLALGLAIREFLERTSMRRKVIIVVVACFIACLTFLERGSLPTSALDRTMMLRYSRWASAFHSWSRAPWFGSGLHSFTEAVADYVNPVTGEVIPIGSAHNDYLDLLVRGGLTYLGVFLMVVISHLIRCFRSRQNAALARLSIVVVVTILAASFVHDPLKSGLLVSLFWLFMGIGSACSGKRLVKSTEETGPTGGA